MSEQRAIAALKPNPLNPRTAILDAASVEELAQSIRSVGLLQPILITPGNVIVAGHRRVIACGKAGLSQVPVIVRDLSETEQIEAMLVENLQRDALDPAAAARAYSALRARGHAVEDIAARTGISRHTIQKHLQILDLPLSLQDKIAAYVLPVGYVQHLVRLRDDPQGMVAVSERAERGNWLVEELKNAVTELLKPPSSQPLPASRSHAPIPAAPRTSSSPATRHMDRQPLEPVVAAKTDARPGQTPRFVDLFCELITLVQRRPALVKDRNFREWATALSGAIRNAQDTAAA